MAGHWSRVLALGFGSGLSPQAPGTAGTVIAWLLFELVRLTAGMVPMVVLTILGLIAGSWICARAAGDLDVDDHPAIVWDEVIGFWLVLLFCYGWLNGGWLLALIAFVLFRLFDALKPPPIGWLDRNVKGGTGIMIDDIGAALASMLVLTVAVTLLPLLP